MVLGSVAQAGGFTPRELTTIRTSLRLRVLWPIVKRIDLNGIAVNLEPDGSLFLANRRLDLPRITNMAKVGERALLLSARGDLLEIRSDGKTAYQPHQMTLQSPSGSISRIKQFIMVNGRILLVAHVEGKEHERLIVCSFSGNCEELRTFTSLLRESGLSTPKRLIFMGEHSPDLGTAGDFLIADPESPVEVPMSLMHLYWLMSVESSQRTDEFKNRWILTEPGRAAALVQQALSETRSIKPSRLMRAVAETVYDRYKRLSCKPYL